MLLLKLTGLHDPLLSPEWQYVAENLVINDDNGKVKVPIDYCPICRCKLCEAEAEPSVRYKGEQKII
ncbi:MAG: hypothetical protein IJ641_09085 [Lachnospiraceae bacterium]|nr:hypothetical protein [Lachnospiraceae bacterium]